MNIKDSTGLPEDVQSVEGTIKTPSGQDVNLVFNKVSTGVYRTTYSLAQAGTTYNLRGSVLFADPTKPSLPFEYSIVTIGSATQEEKSSIFLTIALISGGVFILIIIIVLIAVTRGKKRRK